MHGTPHASSSASPGADAAPPATAGAWTTAAPRAGTAAPAGPRNLVLCCDGTGNVWRPGPGKTNVVKLVQCLVRDTQRQLYFYDPGVGTPDGYISESGQSPRDVVRRVAGLVWGDGVWRNVADTYAFLVDNYRVGDRVFLFGFSRGAFTARAVSGLVNLFGILRREHANMIPTLLSVYRTESDPPPANPTLRAPPDSRAEIGASIKATFAVDEVPVPIHFIGVWETVESVGLSQLALGAQLTSDPSVKPAFGHVRHALALDELRLSYSPRLYTVPAQLPPGHSVAQVWFAGAHGDIGGGYSDAGLANISLHWLVREANALGLLVDFDQLDAYAMDPLATLHNEVARIPAWMAAGAFRRDLPRDACLHDSVQLRRQDARAGYRLALPPAVQWATTSIDYCDRHGSNVSCAPPRAYTSGAADPPRDRIAGWFWLWLACSGGASLAAVWHVHARQGELALAQIVAGWRGGFGATLALLDAAGTDDGHAVSLLLRTHALTVVCIATLLPALAFLAARGADRDAAVSERIGRTFMLTGWLAPLAALAADALCAWALDVGQAHAWLGAGLSLLIGACATVAWLALGAFAAALVACLLHAPRR